MTPDSNDKSPTSGHAGARAGIALPAASIKTLCKEILLQLGTPAAGAETVAEHLADNDLMGVRSMGALRMVRYIEQIGSGYIDNNGEIQVEAISPVLVHVNAHRNFGCIAFGALMPELIDRARQFGIAGGAVVNCSHTGRIGAYSEAVAKHFMWSLVFGGGGREKLKEVAPYGGAKGVFDTNPYASSLPIDTDQICTTDFATSATAQGKMLVYRTNKTPVPQGWIIDRYGKPTTDAEEFYSGGAMLPSAGPKGYGLAIIAELFGHAALGTPHELNWFMVAVDLGRFAPQDQYLGAARSLKHDIEQCPPLDGFAQVLWPGQPELQRKQAQAANGIVYSADEVRVLSSLAERFNVESFTQQANVAAQAVSHQRAG